MGPPDDLAMDVLYPSLTPITPEVYNDLVNPPDHLDRLSLALTRKLCSSARSQPAQEHLATRRRISLFIEVWGLLDGNQASS